MFIVPKELYFSAFQEKTARKRLPKVPQKNSCRCWVLLCNLPTICSRTKRQRVDPCWSMLMPYAASFTKVRHRYHQGWCISWGDWGSKADVRDRCLDQIGLMVEVWPGMAVKKTTLPIFPDVLNPLRRQVIYLYCWTCCLHAFQFSICMPARRKRNAPKKKKRQRTPVFLAGGSSMMQYSNSRKQILTTFLAMLQDWGEPLLSLPKIPICIINCSWLVIVIYCN